MASLPDNEVRVKALELEKGAYLFELPAELNKSDEKPYLDACPPPLSGDGGFVLLDFSKVQRMNGLGAGMIVKLSVLAMRRRQKLVAFGLNDHYRKVFEFTELSRALQICRDRGEALVAAGVKAAREPQQSAAVAASDVSCWAKPVARLVRPSLPRQAINLNMGGRRVVGPVDGFGPLWQKTYRLPLINTSLSPEGIIQVLKQNFPSFQPRYNRFYPSEKGIAPGEVIAIDSSTPGGPVSTGVMVLYADDVSFTFITPQGHPESGWVTFSAFRSGGNRIAQIVGLARANDPVYELAFRAVGSRMQIKIWTHVLSSLATYLGVPADVTVDAVCIDPSVRWSQSRNLWYNAQIRTMLSAPVWWIGKKMSHRQMAKA